MRVSEIFYSLQGEGFLAGVPSIFVRLAGCPLRCRWCDTKYAWTAEAATNYSIETILRQTSRWNCSHVVVTGGEPMINPDMSARFELPDLLERFKKLGKHVTIETSGIAYVPGLACDLMSISPKLSNSTPQEPELSATHEKIRLDTAVLKTLIENYNYQLKFVIDQPGDLDEVLELLHELEEVDRDRVMLMPQAGTTAELADASGMVAQLCLRSGFAFCQRLQVLLWNGQAGM